MPVSLQKRKLFCVIEPSDCLGPYPQAAGTIVFILLCCHEHVAVVLLPVVRSLADLTLERIEFICFVAGILGLVIDGIRRHEVVCEEAG